MRAHSTHPPNLGHPRALKRITRALLDCAREQAEHDRGSPAADDRRAKEAAKETLEVLGLYMVLRAFYAGDLA